MLSLRYRLTDRLHDSLQLFDRPNNPTLDKLQFRDDRRFELVVGALICIDVLDSVFGLRVIPQNVRFSDKRMEDGRKMLCKSCTRGEEVGDSFVECLRILQ